MLEDTADDQLEAEYLFTFSSVSQDGNEDEEDGRARVQEDTADDQQEAEYCTSNIVLFPPK